MILTNQRKGAEEHLDVQCRKRTTSTSHLKGRRKDMMISPKHTRSGNVK